MSVKEKIIEYRNNNRETRVLLGVVLGEFERIEKEKDRAVKEITDIEAINVVKKLINSNIECGELEENKVLELFIPKQMTEQEISDVISTKGFNSIGECMGYFALNYKGLYNGKIVSSLFNKK